MTPATIRALRQRLGLNQIDFAKRLGVSVRSINNWEAGDTVPRSRAHLDRLEQTMRTVPGFAEMVSG